MVPAISTPLPSPVSTGWRGGQTTSGWPPLRGHVWTRKVRKGGSPGRGLAEAGGRAASRPPEVVVAPAGQVKSWEAHGLERLLASRSSVLVYKM